MRSSLSANVVLGLLAAASASIVGCSSPSPTTPPVTFPSAGAGGAAAGTAGAPAQGGSVGTAGAPAGGAATTAGAGGAATTAGAGGAAPTAGAGGAAPSGGAGGAAPAGGAGGAPAGGITKVAPTAGCGMAPPGAFMPGQTSGKQTITTMGTKMTGCADHGVCGAWTYPRDYYVTLPAGYVNTKAYPLVFEGPGCGGSGTDVYPLTGPAAGNAQNANNTVIRVGLTPPPNAINHATNPNQGCFDDKEGDDSVDWVFYENLWDKLAGQICFDKNRVFATGNSSGAWFSNEVGCKYAGDPVHPIRGIMPNTGGLPTETAYVPTCTNKPMAGMWVGETNDPENAFAGNVVGINRAVAVNGCTGGNWPNAPTADYPIAGSTMTCKQLTGCPVLYPLVVCLLVGNAHQSHDTIANPGFSKFLQFFSTGAQITQ
jgi:hypothetical protein